SCDVVSMAQGSGKSWGTRWIRVSDDWLGNSVTDASIGCMTLIVVDAVVWLFRLVEVMSSDRGDDGLMRDVFVLVLVTVSGDSISVSIIILLKSISKLLEF